MTSDPTPVPHLYKVHLTEREATSLTWIAARYETAEILCNHMHLCDDVEPDAYGSYPHGPAVISLPEHVAWGYVGALAEENGNPNQMVPTCVGGELSEKLLALYLEIG